MKKTNTDQQATIDCGDTMSATTFCLAAFRYAFGRMTSVPGVVQEVIRRNAATLTDNCLALLDRELTEAAERYETMLDKTPRSNYGLECDRRDWLAFHDWVKSEIIKRKEGGAK